MACSTKSFGKISEACLVRRKLLGDFYTKLALSSWEPFIKNMKK